MKTGKFLCVVAAALLAYAGQAVAARVPRAQTFPAELRSLQGTWNLIETDVQGQSIKPRVLTQWVFTGNKLFLRVGGRTVPQGFVAVSNSQKPKAISLIVQGRPAVLGIYDLRGAKLEVCASSDQRPTVFVAEGSNVVSVLEKAATPHPRRSGRI